MTESIWGADKNVWQVGAFTDDETATLKEECASLGIVPKLSESSEWALHRLYYDTAASALDNLARIIQPAKLGIDPRLRFVAFFGTADQPRLRCDASARRAPTSVPNTYVIKVNVEGVVNVGIFIDHLIGGLEPELRDGMPGMNLMPGHDGATYHCLRFATFFVFLHELAHVVRGHLDWQVPLLGSCEEVDAKHRTTRRALEEDADTIAATWLGELYKMFQGAQPVYGEVEADPLSWGFSALLGCFAFLALVSEGGLSKGPCYHLPFTRLMVLGPFLNISIVQDASRRLLAALTADQLKQGLPLVPEENSLGVQELMRDMEAHDKVTRDLLTKLRKAGRLNGWLLPSDSSGRRPPDD